MDKDLQTKKVFDGRLLLVTTLIISICSIIYELIISSITSYLLGDSITQFSITIGLYMSAMGIGSYLSKFIKIMLNNNKYINLKDTYSKSINDNSTVKTKIIDNYEDFYEYLSYDFDKYFFVLLSNLFSVTGWIYFALYDIEL